MFLLKKLVAPLFFPVPLLLGLLVVGALFLWRPRRQRLGRLLVTLSAALLVLASYAPVADALLEPLEHRYPPLDLQTMPAARSARWIVVLGGGQTSDPAVPPSSRLSDASLARTVEGVRLHRLLPGAKLLFSGGAVFNPVPEADGMARLAEALGVKRRDIALDPVSRDTAEQARRIQALLGGQPFILVTSASHMPRAMGLFEKRGLHPIPAPTDYLAKRPQAFNPRLLFPSAGNLAKSERAAYEYLGIVWERLRAKM